jgi:hypothetical protein
MGQRLEAADEGEGTSRCDDDQSKVATWFLLLLAASANES